MRDGLSTLELIFGAVTAALAVYAAVVGTVSLVLQRRDKRRREETRCEVEVGLFEMLNQEPAVMFEHQLNEIVNVVQVNLINRSEHPVRWMGLAFHKQGGGPDEWLVPAGFAYPPVLPLTLPSRDAAARAARPPHCGVRRRPSGLKSEMRRADPVREPMNSNGYFARDQLRSCYGHVR